MLTKLSRFGALLALPLAFGGAAAAQYYDEPQQAAGLMLFSGENYYGETREVFEPVYSLNDYYFNDVPRSVAVLSGAWELCEHADFTGRCVFVRDDIPDLGWYGLEHEISSARPIYEYTEAQHGLMFVRDQSGYIRYADSTRYGYDDYSYGYGASTRISIYHYGYSPTYRSYGYYDPHLGYGPYGFAWTRHGVNRNYGHGYHREHYRDVRGHYGAKKGAVTLYTDAYGRGASLGLNRGVADLSPYRFNDSVSSVNIRSGKWEVCEHANFRGRCQVIDASTNRLNGIRLNDNISSIRPVGDYSRGDGAWGGHRDGNRDGRRNGGNHQGRNDGNHGGRDGDDHRNGGHRGQNGLAGGPVAAAPKGNPTARIVRNAQRPQPQIIQPQRSLSAPATRQGGRDVNRQSREVRSALPPRVQQQGNVRREPDRALPAMRGQRPNSVKPPQPPQRVNIKPQQRPQIPAMKNRQVPSQVRQAPVQRAQPAVQRPQVRSRPQQAQSRPKPQQQARPQAVRPQQVQQRPAPRPQPQQQQRPPQAQNNKQNGNNLPKALRNRGNKGK